MEAIASRFEAIALRLEAIALRLEAIALRLEAIALRLEAIALRLEAIASRVEAIDFAERETKAGVYVYVSIDSNPRRISDWQMCLHKLHLPTTDLFLAKGGAGEKKPLHYSFGS